jgi:hypothetical protein
MRIKISLAGIILAVSWPKGIIPEKYLSPYQGFSGKGKPDINLTAKWHLPEGISLGEDVYDTKSTWALSRNNGNYFIRLRRPPFSQLAKFDALFSKGTVYYQAKKKRTALDFYLNPFDAPLIHFVLLNLISEQVGILVHSCGVIDRQMGYLFIGESGSGKSTIATFFKNLKLSTVLSDEYTFIKKKGNKFFIFGSPWSGTARISSNASGELKKIFFIRHAPKHSCRELDASESAMQMFRSSLVPYWNKVKVDKTLSSCIKISNEIKAYSLGFSRHPSIVEFIRTI